ncbi:MAG TPA: archaeal proteasome endopeptidase complex subunit alpha [Candidatus Paceibacterota bacterium]|nr:archaeal proteasome endopeptidase complex subunit alpha [Candidatus Paceibacterota bacterium]
MDMPSEIQHQAMGYDRAATMFSPDGHLLQVEYAEKTVRLGSSSIGIVCTDGVVIVADRRVNDKLIVPESASKVYVIDDHIIASAAGILSDARVLVERGRIIAQQNRVTYDSPVEVEEIIRDIANAKQSYTQYGGARPFGVAIMVAGIDHDESKVFSSDITGNYFAYKAMAIGENDEKIKEMLRIRYNSNLNVNGGIKLALEIFKEILGKNFEISRFDVAYVNKEDKKYKRMDENTLKTIMK